MFAKQRQRVPGVLVGDLLALSRGELLTKRKRQDSAPHHTTCPTCQFERWDGRSPHPRGGKRFAREKCLGPTLAERQRAAGDAKVTAAPLVAELLELASPVDAAEPAPVIAPAVDAPKPDPHLFRPLGTGRPT